MDREGGREPVEEREREEGKEWIVRERDYPIGAVLTFKLT